MCIRVSWAPGEICNRKTLPCCSVSLNLCKCLCILLELRCCIYPFETETFSPSLSPWTYFWPWWYQRTTTSPLMLSTMLRLTITVICIMIQVLRKAGKMNCSTPKTLRAQYLIRTLKITTCIDDINQIMIQAQSKLSMPRRVQ